MRLHHLPAIPSFIKEAPQITPPSAPPSAFQTVKGAPAYSASLPTSVCKKIGGFKEDTVEKVFCKTESDYIVKKLCSFSFLLSKAEFSKLRFFRNIGISDVFKRENRFFVSFPSLFRPAEWNSAAEKQEKQRTFPVFRACIRKTSVLYLRNINHTSGKKKWQN